MVIFSRRVDAILAVLGVVGAIAFLYLFGIHGFLRSAELGSDFNVFHDAAKIFLLGGDPWLELKDSGGIFSYPPHTASLLGLYGLFSKSVALTIHTIINVLSIGVFAWLANRWFLRITDWRSMSMAQGAGLAFIIGNPFMAHSVYEGQLALPATAAILLSWHYLNRGHTTKNFIFTAFFLALATVKPQVSLLYILWLVLERRFAVLACAGAVAAFMLTPALITVGPLVSFEHWFISMGAYLQEGPNQPGSMYVVGLESFLVAIGLSGFAWVSKILCLILLGLIWAYRNKISKTLTVNLFFVLSLTFIYGHDTDYAALMMVWSLLVYVAFSSQSWFRVIITGLLTIGLFFPQRFLREIDIDALHHTRTFIIPLGCYFIYLWQKARYR